MADVMQELMAAMALSPAELEATHARLREPNSTALQTQRARVDALYKADCILIDVVRRTASIQSAARELEAALQDEMSELELAYALQQIALNAFAAESMQMSLSHALGKKVLQRLGIAEQASQPDADRALIELDRTMTEAAKDQPKIFGRRSGDHPVVGSIQRNGDPLPPPDPSQ